MEIKPTYCSFEQAKLLKEKGFDLPVYSYYFRDIFNLNYSIINQYSKEYFEDKGEYLIIPYTSGYRNLYLETINFNGWDDNDYSAPEQWQVVEWLRVKHGIWIEVGVGNLFHKDKFYILIKKYNVDRWDSISLNNKTHSPYNSPQEAYSAAFDYVLKELI